VPLEERLALALLQREMPQPEKALPVAVRARSKLVEHRPSLERLLAPVPLLPDPRHQSPPRPFEWAQSALR
jgi:hypothetical protein